MRVPAEFAEFGLRDALAVIALGLLAGVLLSVILRGLTRPRATPESQLGDRIASLKKLAPQDHLAGLAQLGAELGADLPQGLQKALYDPAAPSDPAAVEAAILAAAGRGRS